MITDMDLHLKGHRFDMIKIRSRPAASFPLDDRNLAALSFKCGHCEQEARIVRNLEAGEPAPLCPACYALTRLPDAPDVWDFCEKPEIKGEGIWHGSYSSMGVYEHRWVSRPHIMTWPAGMPKPSECEQCAAEAEAKLAAFVTSFREGTSLIASQERKRREAERVRQEEALAAIEDIGVALAAAEAVSLAERFVNEGDLDAQREWGKLDPEVAIAAMDAATAAHHAPELLPFPPPRGFVASADGTWLPRPPRTLALQHAGPGIAILAWFGGVVFLGEIARHFPGDMTPALFGAAGILLLGAVIARLNARFWKWRGRRYNKRREEWQAKGLGRWPKN